MNFPFRSPRFRELCVVYAVTIALVSLVYHLRFIPFIQAYLTLITAGILLYIPMAVYWRRGEPFVFVDRSWSDTRRSLIQLAYLCMLVFPLAFLGNHIYQDWVWNFTYRGSPAPSLLITFFLKHLLFIALPEEFFYRGYVQERLNLFFSKPWRILGTSCGPAWLLTACVFAASHSIIVVRWWHIFIFFPGLAFGWLKERTGTILAPVLFHAACNTFAYWVFLSYA